MTAPPPADLPAGMSRREWRERNAAAAASGPAPVTRPVFGSAPSVTDEDAGPLTILTVCTGNICRSPMAEVVLRSRLDSLGVRVHSAGTHALVGHEMTEPAQALALRHGANAADAANHSARYLAEPLLLSADLVLTMTREHRTRAITLVPGGVRRTFTVRRFARLASALSTDEAQAAADAAGDAPRARFAAVLQAIADRGARASGIGDAAEDDVVDPYRRSQDVYEKAAQQLFPALDEVERIVRAALD